jgi:hypothetical protein
MADPTRVSNPNSLYRNPVPLDAELHRHKRLQPLTDYSIANSLHATYVGVDEFGQAALEYVIMFVDAGNDSAGRAQVTPAVLLGVKPGENLMVEGKQWKANYIPAFIRRYPFWTTDTTDPNAASVLVDAGWPGFSDTEGEPLFDTAGVPTTVLREALEFINRFEAEALRAREFCARLVHLDVLRETKADAVLPDGKTLSVKGFYSIEEAALRSLPDTTVLDLHRSGALALMHAHLLSLAHLRPMIERKVLRMTAAAAAVAPVKAITALPSKR